NSPDGTPAGAVGLLSSRPFPDGPSGRRGGRKLLATTLRPDTIGRVNERAILTNAHPSKIGCRGSSCPDPTRYPTGWAVEVGVALLPLVRPWVAAPRAAEAGQASAVKPRTGMTVWDTGRPSGTLTAAALAGKNDWTVIPLDRTAASFQGDAVLSNGRVVAVLRRQDAAVEVHAVKPDGVVARLRLRLLTAAGEPAARLERVALVEKPKAGACLEASSRTARGAAVAGRFRLKRGEVAVQSEPGAGAGRLRVECAGRFVVLPDFFADDIAIDATRLPLGTVELPSENFVLHLTGQGD